jgi:hypothetical protein
MVLVSGQRRALESAQTRGQVLLYVVDCWLYIEYH